MLGRRMVEMIILKSSWRRQCRIVRVGLKWLYWRRPIHISLENCFLTKSRFYASTIIFKCMAFFLTRFPAKIVYAFRVTLIRKNWHVHRSAACFISALLVTQQLVCLCYGNTSNTASNVRLGLPLSRVSCRHCFQECLQTVTLFPCFLHWPNSTWFEASATV
jgi:hypothetical protein